ncbi:MAG: hypothetical protein JKX76_11570 [Colwellia sp.]|nr:hypothetical protein [Colwellia sp.]
MFSAVNAFSDSAKTLKEIEENAFSHFSDSIVNETVYDSVANALFTAYFQCMNDNWNGYDARAISLSTLNKAMTFFSCLPETLPKPEVTPEPDGEIALEWYGDDGGVFSISVNKDKQLSYSGLFADGSKVHGEENIDSFDKEIFSKFIFKAIKS